MLTVRAIAPLLAAAALLTTPQTVSADMQLGFQGDATIVDNQGIGRPAALDLIQGSGAQWVRIMVIENEWNAGHGARFISAAADAKARGLNVMATMYRWRGQDGTERPGITAPEMQRFASEAVPAMAPYVDAWGTTNEPNHTAFAPRATPNCRIDKGKTAHAVIVRNGKRWVVSYKRVKKGKGKYVKRVSYERRKRGGGTHKRIQGRYTLKPGGRWLRRVTFHRKAHGNYVKRMRPARKTIWLSTEYEVSACVRLTWALAYRPIHDVTARVIRAHDPSATVIAGDLAPGGSNSDFFEAMFAAAPGPVDADALGFHPYVPGWDTDPMAQGASDGTTITSIEDIVARTRAWHRQGRVTGGQTWITEFGFPPSAPASYWTSALNRAENAGVPVMILYELTEHPLPGRWDTGLLERDGTPRPSWGAATRWITSRS